MSPMARVTLRIMAVVFGFGAITNTETDPFVAGMLTVLCAACLVLTQLSRLVSVTRESLFPPTTERTFMDEDQVRGWAKDIIENIEEIGAFRFDSAPKVLCPICKTWLECDAATLNGEPPIGGMTIDAKAGSAVTQIHVEVKLHVHDHECVGANDVVRNLAQAIRDQE